MRARLRPFMAASFVPTDAQLEADFWTSYRLPGETGWQHYRRYLGRAFSQFDVVVYATQVVTNLIRIAIILTVAVVVYLVVRRIGEALKPGPPSLPSPTMSPSPSPSPAASSQSSSSAGVTMQASTAAPVPIILQPTAPVDPFAVTSVDRGDPVDEYLIARASTCASHQSCKELNISVKQAITSGKFSQEQYKRLVAKTRQFGIHWPQWQPSLQHPGPLPEHKEAPAQVPLPPVYTPQTAPATVQQPTAAAPAEPPQRPHFPQLDPQLLGAIDMTAPYMAFTSNEDPRTVKVMIRTAVTTALRAYKLSSKDNNSSLGGIGAGLDLTGNDSVINAYAAEAWASFQRNMTFLDRSLVYDARAFKPSYGAMSQEELEFHMPGVQLPGVISRYATRLKQFFSLTKKVTPCTIQDYYNIAATNHTPLNAPPSDFHRSTLLLALLLSITLVLSGTFLMMQLSQSTLVRKSVGLLEATADTATEAVSLAGDGLRLGRSATNSLDGILEVSKYTLLQVPNATKSLASAIESAWSAALSAVGSGISSMQLSTRLESLTSTASSAINSMYSHTATKLGYAATLGRSSLDLLWQWIDSTVETIPGVIYESSAALLNESAKCATVLANHTKRLYQETSSRVLTSSSALLDRTSLLLQNISSTIGTATSTSTAAFTLLLAQQLDILANGSRAYYTSAKLAIADAMMDPTGFTQTLPDNLAAMGVVLAQTLDTGLLTTAKLVGVSAGVVKEMSVLAYEAATSPEAKALYHQAHALAISSAAHLANAVEASAGIVQTRTVPLAFHTLQTLKSISPDAMARMAQKASDSLPESLSNLVSEASAKLCGLLCRQDHDEARRALASGLCAIRPGISQECRALLSSTQLSTLDSLTRPGWFWWL